ncbi:MAG: PrsW family intramembrane metalloprotease [Acidimicrobiia bacterium]
MTATAFIAGVAPAVAWMGLFWWWDRHDREPLRLILVLFLVGAIPVGFLAGFVNSRLAAAGLSLFVMAVIVAPIGEESLKYLGAKITVRKSRAFDEPVDGMVYGTAVGLGFAAAENIGYLVWTAMQVTGRVDLIPECVGRTPEECALILVLPIRAIGTTLVHGLASGLAGFTLSKRRFVGVISLPYARLPGLLAAIVLHSAWNLTSGLGQPSPLLIAALGATAYATVFKACLRISPHAVARLKSR